MEDELEGVTTVLLGSGSSAWRSFTSSWSFWTRERGERTTVVTVAASGGDELRSGRARGRGRRGGERGERSRGSKGLRGNARGVQAVEEAGEQGGGGARVRRAQLLLCLLARGRRPGCPWWAGPPGVLASWAVTAPGQVSQVGFSLCSSFCFINVFYYSINFRSLLKMPGHYQKS